MTVNKCRHRKTWLVADGRIEWCYKCGALRELKRIRDGSFARNSRWVIPVGKNGKNPWEKLHAIE